MNSTGRVLWLIWSCGWAAVWLILGAVVFPHRACTYSVMISANGNFCTSYGTVGSGGRAALFFTLALVSAAVGVIPMIVAHVDKPPAPPPTHPVRRWY